MSEKSSYTIKRPEDFDLGKIFDCGQSFRFTLCGEGLFEGVAFGKYLKIGQNRESVVFYDTDESEYETIWKRYFSLDTDYEKIHNDILRKFGGDNTIQEAMKVGNGIRILRQDPWEALCTFILSQNNNIPRIRKLVAAMSERYGEKIICGGSIKYAFPCAEAVAEAGSEKLRELSVGFRAPYLADAAEKVSSGYLELESAAKLDTKLLIEKLMTIKGVGPKVAACTALFGFGKFDAFPIDVWMKRVISEYYPNGLDVSSLGSYAGIAQQYLFYYERYKVK